MVNLRSTLSVFYWLIIKTRVREVSQSKSTSFRKVCNVNFGWKLSKILHFQNVWNLAKFIIFSKTLTLAKPLSLNLKKSIKNIFREVIGWTFGRNTLKKLPKIRKLNFGRNNQFTEIWVTPFFTFFHVKFKVSYPWNN